MSYTYKAGLLLVVTCLFSTVLQAAQVRVVATTFPLYMITKNVVMDSPSIKLEILMPPNAGCPHDYALSPKDMMRLAKAQVLILNGLGLEVFWNKSMKKTYNKLVVIDSSEGVSDRISFASPHSHGAEHAHDHTSQINPHLFVSPRLSGELAIEIAKGLAKADPKSAQMYRVNAQRYQQKMNRLNAEFVALGKGLKNNRIIQSHGVFDYLFADTGIEIEAQMQPKGQEPSAAKITRLIHIIREHKVGALFSEPQYPQNTAQLLSRETGVPTAVLNPVESGPLDAPRDYFAQEMRLNIQTIQRVLGSSKASSQE